MNLYVSSDGTAWNYEGPVFYNNTDETAWDAAKIDAPSVMFDGERYRLYYQGYQVAANSADRVYQIGVAFSDTIYGEFSREGRTEPIVGPSASGTFDDYRVFHPWVVKIRDLYCMWYTGGDTVYRYVDEIGFATSTDGVNWTKHGSVVGVHDGIEDCEPTVVQVGDTWHMWYMHGSNVYHTTSTPGLFTVDYEILASALVTVNGTAADRDNLAGYDVIRLATAGGLGDYGVGNPIYAVRAVRQTAEGAVVTSRTTYPGPVINDAGAKVYIGLAGLEAGKWVRFAGSQSVFEVTEEPEG